MNIIDLLWILHPFLAVVLIYPLIGVVIRLALQTRARRLRKEKFPPTVGRDHSDLGRWLSAGVVILVLIALTVVITTKTPITELKGGLTRAIQLLLVLLGTITSLLALWHCKSGRLRLSFSLITWAGVLVLGAQPEVWRLSDNPLTTAFWQSHYWAGVGVTGLMLFSLGARPEILRDIRIRRLHVTANALAALLFLTQGFTGTRDLLTIPLSWQKSTIASCAFTAMTCPLESSAESTHDSAPKA